MSRSRRPQCSVGRGCGVCGDAGENRRKRERAWVDADADFLDEIEAALRKATYLYVEGAGRLKKAQEALNDAMIDTANAEAGRQPTIY